MPMALEQLDLSEYDLVISSESGPAKEFCLCRARFTSVTVIPHEIHLEYV